MISVENDDNYVFIMFQTNWKEAKFYHKGKLVLSNNAVEKLQEGITFDIPNLGRAEFKLDRKKHEPTLYVNDEIFLSETKISPSENSVTGVVILFCFFAFSNFLPFALNIANYEKSTNKTIDMVFLFSLGFFIIIYTLCAILLYSRKYLFYFIGTVLFTCTTLYFCYLSFFEEGEIFLLFVLPRLLLIGLLLRYLKRVLRLMRTSKNNAALLDSTNN